MAGAHSDDGRLQRQGVGMKDRLYYQDVYQQSFTAAITKRGAEADGTPYVVLSQTAFYPTGGGQPADHGFLGEVRVIDAEEIDGEIRHRLEEQLPESWEQVNGQIDWERRFDHMQQHAGQHILSASFREVADAETVAFHLGSERVTIDVRLDELTPDVWEKVERRANQIILENHPIIARFVDEDEWKALPLHKLPTVTQDIRLVIIPDFDYNPCGGTHPSRTGEVGLIKILGWERHRGNVRLEFLCGWRAMREYTVKQQRISDAVRLLGTNEAELGTELERLLAERDALKQALHEKERLLLAEEVRQALVEATPIGAYRLLQKSFADRTIQQLQQFAQQVNTQATDVISLLATTGEKRQLVFSRGQDVPVAMNQLMKEVLPAIDGKGGGSPTIAQGGGQANLAAEEVLSLARQKLEELIQ
ncbi:alanyl-tRNA editing protein [Brevibacillus panacihumi]|uniref:alanyl-tRNA editing protein n=1 Tax=Brevibacillus panacihumi TaxID=497735 RepID=UPI003D03601D